MNVVQGNWKLLQGEGETNLYDLGADFGETKDLASENASVVDGLLAEAEQYIASQETLASEMRKGEEEGPVQIDARMIEQLKALGYLK